jgi:predicted transcriptional regulator
MSAEVTERSDQDLYKSLINNNIDFRVEPRKLNTPGDLGPMEMPDHVATVRINPDGSEIPLWVVGSRYEVVDHREIIRGFAEALEHADLEADVDHKVYGNGCRIYSLFTLKNTYSIGEDKPPVRPFFTLMTSHDGSLKLGFMVGAKYGHLRLNVAKTVYGNYAKHTRGVNIEKTLSEIEKALNAFVNEVIPMWERMTDITLTTEQVEHIMEDAVKKKVLSKRRAENVARAECKTVWDTYRAITEEVSAVRGKRGTEERAFDRNTKVGEYFRKLAKTELSSFEDMMTSEE